MKNFDSILSDVFDNAKTAANALSKQAAKLYDASKHKISAEAIKRTIAKKLIELGKLTYKAITQEGDLADEINAVVGEITELKKSLATIEANLADINNQKICPDCGNKVTKESVFCNTCGHKFEAPVDEEAAEEAAQKVVEEMNEEDVTTDEEIVVAAQEAAEEIAQAPAKAAEEATETVEETAPAEEPEA